MPNLVDAQGKVIVSPDGDKAVRTQDPNVRPEPNQPSPTRGDGELYDMVDPMTGIDQGGNPLMEGTLAQDDNGWQPDNKRDEYYANKESSVYDFTDPEPTHTFVVDRKGQVFAASGNVDYDAIAAQHGIDGYETAQGQVFPDGQGRLDQNNAGHSPEALEEMLKQYMQKQIQMNDASNPAQPNRVPQYTTPHQVSKPSFSHAQPRVSEPYESLWEKKAEIVEGASVDHLPHQATVVPSTAGLHNATLHHLAFLDACVNGQPARGQAQSIMGDHGPNGKYYGHPVVVSTHHPDHLPAAVAAIEDPLRGPSPEGFKHVVRAMKAGTVPAPPGIDINTVKVSGKIAFLPALPIAGLVGRTLLGQAIGGLVRGAFGGSGNNAVAQPTPIDQSTQTLGAIDRGLGNDSFSESEDGDTHQYNDGDMSPDAQNPNLDEDGGATKGEGRESSFADDSPGISRAEELLEKLIHYYHSDKSGATDDELRDLDELLETEHPGYKDKTDDNALHQMFLVLKSPEGISHHETPSKKAAVTSDNHQGPVTDEQRAAVTKLLQSQGRDAEIPTMLQEPWNYSKELAEITQDNPRPNNVDPETNPVQPPPPPAEMDPSAQMPVPDPSQSMAAPLAKRWSKIVHVAGVFEHVDRDVYNNLSLSEQKQVRKHLLRAKSNGPQLHWTPGMAGRGVTIAGVPHTWNTYDPTNSENQDFGDGHYDYATKHSHPLLADFKNAVHISPEGQVSGTGAHINRWQEHDPRLTPEPEGAYSFSHKEAADPNPLAVPAADQTVQDVAQNRTDSTQTWQDTNGQPLVEGQTYTVHNPEYTIPDVVRIVNIKPTSIVVESIGQWQNTPGVDPEENAPIAHQREIQHQEVQMEGLTFEPGDPQSQDSQNAQDPSLQATSSNREWLLSEDDSIAKEAGVKFSPNEQRAFIDEQGVARNADKLDLSNTHYERETKSKNLLDDSFLW